MVTLPDIPDPPPNHRLRTLTFLATGAVLVTTVAADSWTGGPVAQREHVFTHVRARARVRRARVHLRPVRPTRSAIAHPR